MIIKDIILKNQKVQKGMDDLIQELSSIQNDQHDEITSLKNLVSSIENDF
jgi:hypothetical protein